ELEGLVYRDPDSGNGSGPAIRRNPGHPTVQDLDSLPYPARDLLDNHLYRSPETGNPLTVIHGNRGCPAACVFCPAGVMSGFRVRHRSPESILGELRESVERFGIREFLFHGDTFTLNKSWLLKLCGLIKESGLKIRWGCNSRVDTIDDERAAAMRGAGCWVVAFGVETGNQEILDKLKKGAKVEQAETAVAVCKRNGLRVHTFFVIGLPWETEETLEQTYQFARKLDPDFFDFNIAYPLPGTEFYEIALAEGLFEKSPDQTGYAQAAVRTHTLPSQYLTEWRRRKLLAMYLRPAYIARMLWKGGSPRVTANYVKAGAKRLRQLVTA
ncbi:radical SAM protein, partial [Candidatus Sumerlaeota bacterium]|nr:radical SAM protein [Candidatus Sumerlaeota bacterium]